MRKPNENINTGLPKRWIRNTEPADRIESLLEIEISMQISPFLNREVWTVLPTIAYLLLLDYKQAYKVKQNKFLITKWWCKIDLSNSKKNLFIHLVVIIIFCECHLYSEWPFANIFQYATISLLKKVVSSNKTIFLSLSLKKWINTLQKIHNI